MCGIIGYIGKRQAKTILIKGLKRLEYRGYDSAGICILNESKLNLTKKTGRISNLSNKIKKEGGVGTIGIAHTRWATHGEPNVVNSHPHTDCKDEIVIVHNGIIENHDALRKILEKEGHKFKSETDSEVVAHLIEKFYAGDLEKATTKALRLIEGAYGLAIMHKNENKIIAARRGSPLIIGIGKDEMFVASDVSAIVENTKNIIYLKDNEIASITDKTYKIKKLTGKKCDPKIHEIKWDISQIEKGGFKHFMLKEIMEQPEAVTDTLRGKIKNGKIISNLPDELKTKDIKRVVITACGTSWHSALIGKYFIESITRIPVEVDYASEFRYRDPIINKDDLFIVISQSGETADTLAALKEAQGKGAKTFGIVNTVGSTIARETDAGIYLHAGPEIGVASTKAFTCQITALLIFALFLKQERGEKIDKQLISEIKGLPSKIKQALKDSVNIRKVAKKFKDNTNFLYLGRGVNYPVALEGALKLKEISYIHAEGYPAAEIKHGPIALIDKNMPTVFIAPQNGTYDKILSNIETVKARQGKIIAIVNKKDSKINKLADQVFQVAKSTSYLSPIINVIPLQLLAYHIADLKNLDIDKPRNLAKSVTVE